MAPNLNKKSNSIKKKNKSMAYEYFQIKKKIIENNFDYVGDKFTEEAKKNKYGESQREIYLWRSFFRTNKRVH